MRFARSYSADRRGGRDAAVIIIDVLAFLVWRGRCGAEGEEIGEGGWTGGGHGGTTKGGEGRREGSRRALEDIWERSE